MTTPSSTLFIGDHRRPEFSGPARWLAAHEAAIARDIPQALSMLADGMSPAVIVVAQAWPGSFSVQQITRLRRAAPLARVIGLLASWLEGEARSGKPWPAAQRRYWHRW